MRVRNLYLNFIHSGIDNRTPELLIDRLIFTNTVVLVGGVLSFALLFVNLAKGYQMLAAMDAVYIGSDLLWIYLNLRRKYLGGRLMVISMTYLAMLFSCVYQGGAAEMEHFFIPLSVIAFCMFAHQERAYSLFFMATGAVLFFYFCGHDQPLWPGPIPHFTNTDRLINRAAYLSLFTMSLYALSNSGDRAMMIITDQKTKLFEERRMAMIGSIAFNLAHEINSPLAALDLHLYQLSQVSQQDQVPGSDLNVRITKMSGVSRRISLIVRSLKFLSRQDDNDPLTHRPLVSLINPVLELAEERLAARRIRLSLHLGNDVEMIQCRPVALSHVFLNLLNNAMDAVENQSDERRWITISSQRHASLIELRIENGGDRIPDSIRANLFRPFYTTKLPGRGVGLGLSISKQTIEEHGGQIRYDESSLNTAFVVVLPIEAVTNDNRVHA